MAYGPGTWRAIITRMDALLVFNLLGGFIIVLGGIVFLSHHWTVRCKFAPRTSLPHGVPLRRRAVLLSRAERAFYETLRGIIPDHMIFVKVKLGELLALNQSESVTEHFSALRRKHVDFVICDITLAPVLAIELEDVRSGATADEVNSVLAKAELPVLRLPPKPHYLLTELRRLLGPYLAVPHPIV